AAVLADRVEQRERSASRANHQPEVSVELYYVAGDPAVVGGVDRCSLDFKGRRRTRLAFFLGIDAQFLENRLLAVTRVVLHVYVPVEADEAAVLEPCQGIDFSQRQTVRVENTRQGSGNLGQSIEIGSADADAADQLLGHEIGERKEGREVALA